MAGESNGNRTTMWALIAGGIAVVVAIVALVIAITANHSTDDTKKIARAVQAAEDRQINGVRGDLQKNVAAATLVLKHLQRDSRPAHRTDGGLKRDIARTHQAINSNRFSIKNNKSEIATNTANISSLQSSVGSLNADIKNLTKTVDNQQAANQAAQQALNQHLKRLQRTVNSLP